MFLERLNRCREQSAKQLKPLTYGRLAKTFEKVPTGDLYPFYRLCEQAKSFSAFFWWSFKTKRVRRDHEPAALPVSGPFAV
jgi:hypothetical protein